MHDSLKSTKPHSLVRRSTLIQSVALYKEKGRRSLKTLVPHPAEIVVFIKRRIGEALRPLPVER
jgi:hypothetical protein